MRRRVILWNGLADFSPRPGFARWPAERLSSRRTLCGDLRVEVEVEVEDVNT